MAVAVGSLLLGGCQPADRADARHTAVPPATAQSVPAWPPPGVSILEAEGLRLVSAPGAPTPTLAEVRRAVRRVRVVLPAWDGRASVHVPATTGEFAAALGGQPVQPDVAAVTLPIGDPARVVVNPTVFPAQAPWARQAVLVHELVHVAADAAHSRAPGWLTEGFADYVALRGRPVAVRGLLKQARQGPEGLPGPAAFARRGTALRRTYARAWLACAALAASAGEAALVAVYTAADEGLAWRLAVRRYAGLTQRQLVASMKRPGSLVVSWGETPGAPGRGSGPGSRE